MSSVLFQEILNTLSKEGAMSQETRDSLILRGIISLFGELEKTNNEMIQIKKIVPLYRILVGIGTLLISLILGLLWEVFTGKAQIIF